MKKVVAVLCLLLVAGLLVSCSSTKAKDVTGTWVYEEALKGQSPILVFEKDGVVKITVPTQQNPENPEEMTQPQNIEFVYETTTDVVKMWSDKESMADQHPSPFFLIYEENLLDGTGGVLVKQKKSSSPTPQSPTPLTPPTTSP